MARAQIFLSAVSAEFESYRAALRRDLDRPNVTVKVQEDFIAFGTATLVKLDDYIRECDAVIHLIGNMTGALALAPSLNEIRRRYPDLAERLPPLADVLKEGSPPLSYTQWEAWLGLYHRKILLIAEPEAGAFRDSGYVLDEQQRKAQQAHLARLAEFERYPEIHFANEDRLAIAVLSSTVHDVLARAAATAKPINLPFLPLGDRFKGRAEALEQLKQALGPVPDDGEVAAVPRVLNGMGGVGKTRLAIEYAWRRDSEYSALLFVSASSPEMLDSGLASLSSGAILNLPEQTETDKQKQGEAVLRWLRTHPGWLLILDNIDSQNAGEAAEKLLPRLTGGHVLLTGRLSEWSSGLALPPLEVLPLEAAREILLDRTDLKRRKQADDVAEASALAEELGCLALALEQAGAFIEQRRLTFAGYRALWKSEREKVLGWSDHRLVQSDHSVLTTWQTSFAQLTAPARQLLERIAWFAPSPIPESLLQMSGPESTNGDGALLDALWELERFSLVARADSPSFSVHRLVQQVTQWSVRNDGAKTALNGALRWIDAAFRGDMLDGRRLAVLEPLLPHAISVAECADAAQIASPTWQLMNRCGAMLTGNMQLADAARFLERSLQLCEQENGPEHPDVAVVLGSLARLRSEQGADDLAGALYERALLIRERTPAPEDGNLVLMLNGLAQVYRRRRQFEPARALYERALSISERAPVPANLEITTILLNLGTLWVDQNEDAKAEPLYERAIAIAEEALGPNHAYFSTALNGLAGIYVRQGAFAKAETLLQRAVKLDEEVLGRDSRAVAESLNNLAFVYVSMKAYPEAEVRYQRALAIFENKLGPEHPLTATCLNNLGQMNEEMGAYAQAEMYHLRALAIREKVLERDHPDVAMSLNNLALVYLHQRSFAQAEPLLERALAINEQAFGKESVAVALGLYNLASLHALQGDYARAEPLHEQALTIFVRKLGADHAQTSAVGSSYMELLRNMGRSESEIREKARWLIEQASGSSASTQTARPELPAPL